jgi:hypothetical protein
MGIQSPTPSADRVSRLRQALYDLRAELGRLLEVFVDREPIMAASLYELRRKCGKPTCRCASGAERHSCMVISWTTKGRKRLRAVPEQRHMELATLTRRYRSFRQARARLVAVHTKMLSIIDRLEALRRKEP